MDLEGGFGVVCYVVEKIERGFFGWMVVVCVEEVVLVGVVWLGRGFEVGEFVCGIFCLLGV